MPRRKIDIVDILLHDKVMVSESDGIFEVTGWAKECSGKMKMDIHGCASIKEFVMRHRLEFGNASGFTFWVVGQRGARRRYQREAVKLIVVNKSNADQKMHREMGIKARDRMESLDREIKSAAIDAAWESARGSEGGNS